LEKIGKSTLGKAPKQPKSKDFDAVLLKARKEKAGESILSRSGRPSPEEKPSESSKEEEEKPLTDDQSKERNPWKRIPKSKTRLILEEMYRR